jgi:uncharacterized protein
VKEREEEGTTMITETKVWVDELETEQCWRLLERGAVGRVGFMAEGEVVIFPVNYAVEGRRILVRTGPTSMLEALAHGATVAFEVDGVDVLSETGWSVLAKGHAAEVDPPVPGEAPTLEPWASGERDHWLAIQPWTVTGRAISREHLPPRRAHLPYMPPD